MTIVMLVVAVLASFVIAFLVVNRPVSITVDGLPPAGFPDDGFSHATFETLLRRHVDKEGQVDFAAWHASAADRAGLESYLAAVAAYSPQSSPDRFASRQDALAYWMYAYNAWVIYSVLEHWPLSSVTDVRAPIEAVTGLGFFYRQRFRFGGESLSLYKVENERIRAAFQDPRIHFVLYCASGSCPPIRPELPAGEALERLLARATHDFLGDPGNVGIDHETETIILSAIFEMYESDFTREVTRRGVAGDRGVLDYVILEAPGELREALTAARDYNVVFRPYDWSIAAR